MTRALCAACWVALCALAVQRSAWGDEPPPTQQEIAAQVQAAHAADDPATLEALARREAPDPWLVADALLLAGAREAAGAFAKAAPRKDVERLAEFVATWKASDDDAAGRKAVEAGNVALQAGRPADALALFEAARGAPTAVVALRLAHGGAIALRGLEKVPEAAQRFEEVARRAEALGWYARAAVALADLTRLEQAGKRTERALAAAQRLLTLETARGLPDRIAEAHLLRAQVEDSRGGTEAAMAALEQALQLYEQAGDELKLLRVTYQLGQHYDAREQPGDLEKALALYARVAQGFEGRGDLRATAAALVHAADACFRLERDEATLEHAERALLLSRKLGIAYLEGRCLHLRGLVAERRKQPEAAQAAYAEAQARFEAAGDKVEAARSLARGAEALRLGGHLPKAREQAERALTAAEHLKDRGVEAFALLVGARVRRDQGQRAEALALARRARAAYEAIRQTQGIGVVDGLIAELELAAPR